MKKFICLAFLALFVVSAAQPLQAADKPEKVRIGYLSLVNGQLLSKYLQLHEKEMGVPVEWFRFNSGRDVNTAMASKSIDFGNVGLPPATIGVAGGMNYWGIMNANVLGAVESLVVRKGINSLKDLEGKTVVAPFGSTTHYLLIKALREAGVDMGKVKIMDMAPGEALAPFIRGDIDAAYIWEPGLGLVVQNGGKILLTSEQMAEKGHLTWDVISVQPEFARKYPELVTKFIKSELAGAPGRGGKNHCQGAGRHFRGGRRAHDGRDPAYRPGRAAESRFPGHQRPQGPVGRGYHKCGRLPAGTGPYQE